MTLFALIGIGVTAFLAGIGLFAVVGGLIEGWKRIDDE